MVEFTIDGFIDVNIGVSADNTVTYLVNNVPVPREDFTAIMSAVKIVLDIEAMRQMAEEDDDDDDDDDNNPDNSAPFGG